MAVKVIITLLGAVGMAVVALWMIIQKLRAKAAKAEALRIVAEDRTAAKDQTEDEAWNEFNKHD